MKKLKVAIVGCGSIAKAKHMPALLSVEECEVVAFCDIILDKAQYFAKKYNPDAKVTADYMDIVNDPEIDVVHVCTQNRGHSQITIDCLRGGKHVMCEKPMAKTAAEAKAMLDAARETGKKLSIGYQNRQWWSHKYLRAKSMSGEFGEIYFAKCHAIRSRGVPTWGHFINEYEQGGGPLIDIGTHALDLALWVMNNYEPKVVMGSVYRKLVDELFETEMKGECKSEDYTVEDSAFGYIIMKNGATIVLESSWALNAVDTREACISVCGTKMGASTWGGCRVMSRVTNDEGKLTMETRQVDDDEIIEYLQTQEGFDDDITIDGPKAEAKQWIRSILEDREPTVKPEQALVVSQILEAIYESGKTGKPVYFD